MTAERARKNVTWDDIQRGYTNDILRYLSDGWKPRNTLDNDDNTKDALADLERRGLIQSRIWGQGDERQLWLRRTKGEDR